VDHLPPLRLLTTFEAVARLGAMRDAAAELNVTGPAVTQALKALEDHVGTTLLDRSTRPARLTESGQQLARATRDGLDMIARTIEEIRAGAGEQSLTVSCTLGMATYWLMPRLSDFYARHPEILVNVQAPPTDLPAISAGIDLALRYGTGAWTDGETTKLFDEIVCPVGQPALVERLLAESIGLNNAPLIHVRSPKTHHWAGWPDYFKHRGLGRHSGSGQFFDNYVQAVQAALNGRGLVLGWRSITEAFVAEGALVSWPDGAVDLGTGYHATLSPAGARKSATQLFLTWLEQHSQ
jgi:LysR family glycine cleavage system transcriptional activator